MQDIEIEYITEDRTNCAYAFYYLFIVGRWTELTIDPAQMSATNFAQLRRIFI